MRTTSRCAGPATVEASATGNFQFQTRSNAGVRLWINGNLVDRQLDQLTRRPNNVTGDIALTKNQRYSVTLEMYDTTSTAVAKFYWKRPGQTTFDDRAGHAALCELARRSSPLLRSPRQWRRRASALPCPRSTAST